MRDYENYSEAWRRHASQAAAAGAAERLGQCTAAELDAKRDACLLIARSAA